MDLNDPVEFCMVLGLEFVGLFFIVIALFEVVLKSKQR